MATDTIPSLDVPGYAGIMMRRRERMSKAGGRLEGFSAPRADDTMPAYSLYAHGLRLCKQRGGMSVDDFNAFWAAHWSWMRRTYDVRTLALGVYDYLLSQEHLQAYAAWANQPPVMRNNVDKRNERAKRLYALARKAPEGVMFAEWASKEVTRKMGAG